MKPFFKIIIAFVIIGLANSVNGQINIPGKIKDKVNQRVEQHVDEAIDEGLDATEQGIEDAADGNNNEDAEKTDTEGSEVKKPAKEEKAGTQQPNAQLQSYTKYDFVPGDKVLFFEDFSQDAVGDFPALWTTNGSGEIRTLNNYPGNWLYLNSKNNVYTLMQDLTLPDNFILEFDVVAAPEEEDGLYCGLTLCLYQGEGEFLDDALYPGKGGLHVEGTDGSWAVWGYVEDADQIMEGRTQIATLEVNKLNHVIIWVQKRRLRIYHKGQKALDLPTVLYQQVKYNRLRFSLWGETGLPYISNIRITSAAPDMRSKLLTEGRVVSYGIYFDSNSDKVKPESYGALNEIAKVLKENADVKIKIVGHTDSDGADAANLDLSKRRAAAVKNELSKTFGIEGSRIETDGKGESQPLAANDTPSNKALNRRVEFIKE
jgi:OmpA-OmpF porin, OOP family